MSKRLHSEIVERLEGLPDEILALESAMEEFGESFGLGTWSSSLKVDLDWRSWSFPRPMRPARPGPSMH